jgi:hypothetical protein
MGRKGELANEISFRMRPKSVYDKRREMKVRAVVALLLVFVTGFVRFCPACDEAALRDQLALGEREAVQQASTAAPMVGHACCQKAPAPDAPATPSSEEPNPGDCGREHVSAILRVAVPETVAEAYAVAGQELAATFALVMAEPTVREMLAMSPVAQADSPPAPLLALPIRI